MKTKQIIKFIIAVGIFYAFLTFNIFHIGENLVQKNKNYLETNREQEEQNSEIDTAQTGHFAGDDVLNLENLCNSTPICEKIQFNGSFTDTEKYTYTKIFNKIIQFIDNNSQEDKQIEEVIDTIEINKENGKRR